MLVATNMLILPGQTGCRSGDSNFEHTSLEDQRAVAA